jgi:uncharacterized protein (TIGR00255 family)
MTGYGQASGEINGASYNVELKTVNNRYFKTTIRLPDPVAFLEEDIEKLLRRSLSRGTVNYSLRLKHAPANMLFEVDETLLRGVVEKLSCVGSSADINGMIDIGSLLGLPGVVVPASPDEETAGQIKEGVLGISEAALNNLKQMRAAEGAALAADLSGHCEGIKTDLERIRGRTAMVLDEYRKRLKSRVDELLAEVKLEVDDETLARELAIYSERSDIAEEITRLDFHLKQFCESCQREDQAGRRLEFIAQEMLRETNTIASKASDCDIARWVVDIKCRVDRIKEQVQNVE